MRSIVLLEQNTNIELLRRLSILLHWSQHLQNRLLTRKPIASLIHLTLQFQWEQDWTRPEQALPQNRLWLISTNTKPIWCFYGACFHPLNRGFEAAEQLTNNTDVGNTPAIHSLWATINRFPWYSPSCKLNMWLRRMLHLEPQRLKWSIAWYTSCVFSCQPQLGVGALGKMSSQHTQSAIAGDFPTQRLCYQRHLSWIGCFIADWSQERNLWTRLLSVLVEWFRKCYRVHDLIFQTERPSWRWNSFPYVLLAPHMSTLIRLNWNKSLKVGLNKAHLTHLRAILQRNRAATQEDLIKRLNAAILQWGCVCFQNQYKGSNSYLHTRIKQWALRRHNRHGNNWTQAHYWH